MSGAPVATGNRTRATGSPNTVLLALVLALSGVGGLVWAFAWWDSHWNSDAWWPSIPSVVLGLAGVVVGVRAIRGYWRASKKLVPMSVAILAELISLLLTAFWLLIVWAVVFWEPPPD